MGLELADQPPLPPTWPVTDRPLPLLLRWLLPASVTAPDRVPVPLVLPTLPPDSSTALATMNTQLCTLHE